MAAHDALARGGRALGAALHGLARRARVVASGCRDRRAARREVGGVVALHGAADVGVGDCAYGHLRQAVVGRVWGDGLRLLGGRGALGLQRRAHVHVRLRERCHVVRAVGGDGLRARRHDVVGRDGRHGDVRAEHPALGGERLRLLGRGDLGGAVVALHVGRHVGDVLAHGEAYRLPVGGPEPNRHSRPPVRAGCRPSARRGARWRRDSRQGLSS